MLSVVIRTQQAHLQLVVVLDGRFVHTLLHLSHERASILLHVRVEPYPNPNALPPHPQGQPVHRVRILAHVREILGFTPPTTPNIQTLLVDRIVESRHHLASHAQLHVHPCENVIRGNRRDYRAFFALLVRHVSRVRRRRGCGGGGGPAEEIANGLREHLVILFREGVVIDAGMAGVCHF